MIATKVARIIDFERERRRFQTARSARRPALLGGPPRPPRCLGPAAKALWRKIAAELVERRILTVLDLPALEILCATYQEFRDAREGIYLTARGRPRTLREYLKGRRTGPELAAMRSAWAHFKSCLAEFGIRRASLTRFGIEVPPRCRK